MCKFEQKLLLMERRMTGNCHVRCGTGENLEITSKSYLSSSFEMVASAMEQAPWFMYKVAFLLMPNHLTEQMGAEFLRLYPAAISLLQPKGL